MNEPQAHHAADPATADSPGSLTHLLQAAAGGDPDESQRLFQLVYDQLLAIARHRMQHENPGHTLQATALVHEAYLRLIGSGPVNWMSQAHFFNAAALAMRRILIEHARRRGRVRRGGEMRRLPIDVVDLALANDAEDVMALDEAVTRLEQRDAQAAGIVHLRFYGGLSVEETAAALGISERTVKRDWAFARAWLFQELERD